MILKSIIILLIVFSCQKKEHPAFLKANQYSNEFLKELDTIIMTLESSKKVNIIVNSTITFFKKLSKFEKQMDLLIEEYPNLFKDESNIEFKKFISEYESKFQIRQQKYEKVFFKVQDRLSGSTEIKKLKNFLNNHYKNQFK